jgi:hypothetical protein
MTAIQCTVSGTANYTVQQTLDDPNSLISPVAAALVSWVNHPDTNLVGASTTVQGNYGYAPVFAKVTLNSGTGVVTATFTKEVVVGGSFTNVVDADGDYGLALSSAGAMCEFSL